MNAYRTEVVFINTIKVISVSSSEQHHHKARSDIFNKKGNKIMVHSRKEKRGKELIVQNIK